MCTEPEAMIPLVEFSPGVEKIVLIGDHKQLRPIVKCKEAEKALLTTSLFERCAERRVTVMLTEQYRMVRL